MGCTLYLVRHGETDWNRLRRVQGSIDIPLNENGVMQAIKLSNRFQQLTLHAIYSSDLKRAYDTALAIANYHPTLQVMTRADLRERSYGLLEGKMIDEVTLTHSAERNDWLELEEFEIEPLATLKDRIFRSIHHIVCSHDEQTVAVISHGGAIGAFLSVISNGETGTGKIKLGNTSVTKIEYDGTYRIQYINDVSHLTNTEPNLVIGS